MTDGWDAAIPEAIEIDGERYDVAGWGIDAVAPVAAFEDDAFPLPLLAAVLTEESLARLLARLADPFDGLDMPDLRPIGHELIQAVYGRPYWTVGRILATVVTEWNIVDGVLALEGIDLRRVLDTDPQRAVNLLYVWLLRSEHDDTRRKKLELDLTTPPVEVLEEDPDLGAEIEGSMFMQAFAAHRRG